MRATAVVVAAGRGERFGAPAKILLPLGGRPLLAHVLDAVEEARTIGDVVLVAGDHARAAIEALLAGGDWLKPCTVVAGGSRRQDSVARGLAATTGRAPVVVVHDAARPLAEPDLFDRCVEAALAHGAAIAAVPIADTIKRAVDGLVVSTVARDDLWAAQTPQAFRRDLLIAALANPIAAATTFTDEAGLLEILGHPIAIVPGDRANIKITVPDDLVLAEALLVARSVGPQAGPTPRHDPRDRGGIGSTRPRRAGLEHPEGTRR